MASDQKTVDDRFALPPLISGPTEVRSVQRELEALDEYAEQSSIREPGKQPLLPKASRLLDMVAGNNGINLLVSDDRARLTRYLQDIANHAPVIHISLASDPSSAFTAKLVAWFRTNLHPYALLRVGLQPSIVAGCIVWTNSKWFDLSLRNRFSSRHGMLLEAIEGGGQTHHE
jgi:F0F1-type ATP synthase delta subunit